MLELLASIVITQGMADWYPVGYNRKATTSINMNTIQDLGNNLWGAEILKQYDGMDYDGMEEVYMIVEINCNIRKFAPRLVRKLTGSGQVIAETTLGGNRWVSPKGSEKGILTICDY
ncbi:MAG: hypothetical protein QNJ74_09895 [Trichodesmium sp. MO_231.B1]|nr:hypothetical protein [Trichodesmium sp. MO_231.B1]